MIDQGKIWREFVALPPEAQQQVADFIALLRTRSEKIDSAKKSGHVSLADAPFIGMWRDREDMQDSSAWIRRIREREWVKAP